MNKTQCIICLLVLLVVILSMGLMFKNDYKETFINGTGLGYIGHELKKPMAPVPTRRNGNIGYEGLGYLRLAKPPRNYQVQSDDQPLSYGFPKFM